MQRAITFLFICCLICTLGGATRAQKTSATPPIAVPVVYTSVPTITSIVANDDSALVSFTPVRGAIDYRAYTVYQDGSMIHPARIKYSGGDLSIEVNGVNPTLGSDIVVEAVDALGPFQDMDPANMPLMDMIINGQGAPANVPNVMIVNGIPSRSAITHLTPVPFTLSGTQVFFDNFRGEQPLVAVPADQLPAECVKANTLSGRTLYQELQNDKWSIRLFDHDANHTKVFFMSNHFMDILYDYNGTVRAKMLMITRSFPTLATGDALHVTWEVDAHESLNRTLGCMVLPASCQVNMSPGTDLPTTHGPSMDCQIIASLAGFLLGDGKSQSRGLPGPSIARWHGIGRSFGGGLNGSDQDLDKRHKFDLYLSSTSVRLLEQGQQIRAATFTPALTWLEGHPLQIGWYHYLYHSAADRVYLLRGELSPRPSYWLDRRPNSDERHWDNVGFEVIPNPNPVAPFAPTNPTAAPTVQPSTTVQ